MKKRLNRRIQDKHRGTKDALHIPALQEDHINSKEEIQRDQDTDMMMMMMMINKTACVKKKLAPGVRVDSTEKKRETEREREKERETEREGERDRERERW